MIILYLLIIPVVYTVIKLILYFIIFKFGKFSYDGFSAMGFAYDSKRDIFYSIKNAWQKKFGYSHLYDVGAPFFQMIIDTEPIRFYYNNKNWLITFWKGQYGITTGAEIGIYTTEQIKVNRNTLYMPASDEEMLDMSFILSRKGKVITMVSAKHWWLAIFKLGMFSRPKDLSMDINIVFPNHQMLEAFLKSFKKLGYTSKDFKVLDNTFCFQYKKPHTHKVWTRGIIADSIRQHINRRNVKLYQRYLGDIIENDGMDNSKGENQSKLIMVNKLIPPVFQNNVDSNEQVTQKILNQNNKNIFYSFDNDYYSRKHRL